MSDLGAACDSDHSGGKRVAPWSPHQRWMVRAAWIEKIMSKTNDTSNLATLEHHDTFADSELDAVTGGAAPKVTARSRIASWTQLRSRLDPMSPPLKIGSRMNLATPLVASASFCRTALGEWNAIDGSLMMALRSNAPHFWTWAAENAQKYLPPEALEFSGFVVGDAHHENFAHYFFGSSRVYVPNDFDDSGVAPFFLDLLKFVGVSHSVFRDEKKISTKLMLRSYISGLTGKRWAAGVPEFIAEDSGVSLAKLDQLYLEKIEKKTKAGNFLPDEGLTLWENISKADQKTFSDLEKTFFVDLLPKNYVIKHRSMFSKGDRGGSRGMVRYLYYLKNSDTEKEILEFKELGSPAVANYTKQLEHRLELAKDVVKTFWRSSLPNMFNITGDATKVFWMRPKLPNFIKLSHSDFKRNPNHFADLTYFIAFRLGVWHGSQLSSQRYANYLESNFEASILKSTDLINHYLDEARFLQKDPNK